MPGKDGADGEPVDYNFNNFYISHEKHRSGEISYRVNKFFTLYIKLYTIYFIHYIFFTRI